MQLKQHPEENRWTTMNLIKSKKDFKNTQRIQLEKTDKRKIKQA